MIYQQHCAGFSIYFEKQAGVRCKPSFCSGLAQVTVLILLRGFQKPVPGVCKSCWQITDLSWSLPDFFLVLLKAGGATFPSLFHLFSTPSVLPLLGNQFLLCAFTNWPPKVLSQNTQRRLFRLLIRLKHLQKRRQSLSACQLTFSRFCLQRGSAQAIECLHCPAARKLRLKFIQVLN